KIVRIVTPGTLTDEALLPTKADRMIAAVHTMRANRTERAGLARMNLANGEIRVSECGADMLDTELHRIGPAELVCAESHRHAGPADGMAITALPDWHFELDGACDVLHRHFGVDSLAGFGMGNLPAASSAA